MTTIAMKDRIKYFQDRRHLNRFWWFSLPGNDYLPLLYAMLEDREFSLMVEWFEETEREGLIGECNITVMSTLLGFISGSSIDSIVQCGHYAGYSTLLMGFALRKMGKRNALFSVDINPDVTQFTDKWVRRAGLTEYVSVNCGDSADQTVAQNATEFFGRNPKAVFIDSSHAYGHTMAELNLWYGKLMPGGLIFAHDASDYAATFDGTGSGGVSRALEEWRKKMENIEAVMINKIAPRSAGELSAFYDACGLGIIQKAHRLAGL